MTDFTVTNSASNAGHPSPFAMVETNDLVRQIARQIRDAILRGRLKPGQHITELQLSRDFGTSRAPVREAARLLESQGLVVSNPRRGFFVRRIQPRDLDDIYDLRICLELHSGEVAIPRLDDGQILRLENQVRKLHELAATGSMEEQILEDFAFHRILLEAGGNARMLKVYDELAGELSMGITLIGHLYDNPGRIADTHDPIMATIRNRDVKEFREAMHFHIAEARRQVVQLLGELQAT